MRITRSEVQVKKKFGMQVFFEGNLMVRIDTIPCGRQFGDIALDSGSGWQKRAASIVADEDLHLLVLQDKYYQVTRWIRK